MKHLLLTAVPFLILSCTPAPYRDADVNLKQLTQPQSVVQPVAQPLPVPPPPPPPVVETPPAGPEQWRAWVPRRVLPNGDVVDGHYINLSLTEPPLEVLEPAKPMPRVPHGAPLKMGQPIPAQKSTGPQLPPTPLPAQPLSEAYPPLPVRPLPPGGPSFLGVD